MRRFVLAAAMAAVTAVAGAQEPAFDLPPADGFRGIWYYNQPVKGEHRYKYSGGFATYPQQHLPIALYSPQADKTFFVFGGRTQEKNELLHMVSYFDHKTLQVARPRILLNKKTDDAHDNPVLQLDGEGRLWIFSNAHGTSRPAFIHRSAQPGRIDRFELVRKTNFSYGQPWHLGAGGFVFLHTLYGKKGRVMNVATSADGLEWSAPRPLASIGQGHYGVSLRHGASLSLAFNYHPAAGGLNKRTNLYYMRSDDAGRTWKNAAGKELALPLTEPANDAIALEYESKGLLVYMKDLQATRDGRPVVLFLTSKGFEPGPANGPRRYTLAEWTGKAWDVREVCDADHNYDFASLYVESETTWRIIGVTEPGPQPWATGGEISMWLSQDAGRTWTRTKPLTRDSKVNHTYPRRPVDAHPDFYALWADGNPLEQSPSRLYFCTRQGQVFRLPERMTQDLQACEKVD